MTMGNFQQLFNAVYYIEFRLYDVMYEYEVRKQCVPRPSCMAVRHLCLPRGRNGLMVSQLVCL